MCSCAKLPASVIECGARCSLWLYYPRQGSEVDESVNIFLIYSVNIVSGVDVIDCTLEVMCFVHMHQVHDSELAFSFECS